MAAERTKRHDARPGLQVLDRAIAVLSLFSDERPAWTMSEIARACDLPMPTVHRILSTLRTHGMLSREESTKRYHLGLAAMELGERARTVTGLRVLALPVLGRLAEDTGETALLTVLNAACDRSVCLERVESSQPLRLSVEPGRQLPLHAGASQKILLAFMSEDDIERVISQGLEKLCNATITKPDTLREELASIRRTGRAMSYEETNPGVWGLAVPVLDGSDNVVAGLGLAGPSARAGKTRIAAHLERLKEAAAENRRPAAARDGPGAPLDTMVP